MGKRLEQLSFIIGIFFMALAFIIGIGYISTDALHKDINLYSAGLFFVFGGIMLLVKGGEE